MKKMIALIFAFASLTTLLINCSSNDNSKDASVWQKFPMWQKYLTTPKGMTLLANDALCLAGFASGLAESLACIEGLAHAPGGGRIAAARNFGASLFRMPATYLLNKIVAYAINRLP